MIATFQKIGQLQYISKIKSLEFLNEFLGILY